MIFKEKKGQSLDQAAAEERCEDPRMRPVNGQDPGRVEEAGENSPAPSQASSGVSSRAPLPSARVPRHYEPHPPGQGQQLGRGGTTSDPTHGAQARRSVTTGGAGLVRRATSTTGPTSPVLETSGQDNNRFSRKGSLNSTSNSLNSSIGSGSRPMKHLINLNYPAVPKLPGLGSPPEEDRSLPNDNPGTDRTRTSDTTTRGSYDLHRKQDSGPDEEPVHKLLHKRQVLQKGVLNLPAIDTAPLSNQQ